MCIAAFLIRKKKVSREKPQVTCWSACILVRISLQWNWFPSDVYIFCLWVSLGYFFSNRSKDNPRIKWFQVVLQCPLRCHQSLVWTLLLYCDCFSRYWFHDKEMKPFQFYIEEWKKWKETCPGQNEADYYSCCLENLHFTKNHWEEKSWRHWEEQGPLPWTKSSLTSCHWSLTHMRHLFSISIRC